MPRYGLLAPSRNAAYGLLNRTRTVNGSTTSVRSYGPMKLNAVCDFVSGSTMRSKVTFTASAPRGVPSWNLTSLRSLNVYVVASGEAVQDVASPGANCPGRVCHTSGSTMCNPILPTRVKVVAVTSRVSNPPAMPWGSVPGAWAYVGPGGES